MVELVITRIGTRGRVVARRGHLLTCLGIGSGGFHIDVHALVEVVVPHLFEVGNRVGNLVCIPLGVDRDVVVQNSGGCSRGGALLVGVPAGEGVALAGGGFGIPALLSDAVAGIAVLVLRLAAVPLIACIAVAMGFLITNKLSPAVTATPYAMGVLFLTTN